jgi:hypothetical protein
MAFGHQHQQPWNGVRQEASSDELVCRDDGHFDISDDEFDSLLSFDYDVVEIQLIRILPRDITTLVSDRASLTTNKHFQSTLLELCYPE